MSPRPELVLVNPWIKFRSNGSLCFVSPDLVLLWPTRGLVVEVKLTRRVEGYQQLSLYKTVCSACWMDRAWQSVLVCKWWSGAESKSRVDDIEAVVLTNQPVQEWHWMGRRV